jgi:hypothetical protein
VAPTCATAVALACERGVMGADGVWLRLGVGAVSLVGVRACAVPVTAATCCFAFTRLFNALSDVRCLKDIN